MHPLATYLTAAQSTTDQGAADDDLRAWSRQQADEARAEARAPRRRGLASILQAGFTLVARRSARSMGRSA